MRLISPPRQLQADTKREGNFTASQTGSVCRRESTFCCLGSAAMSAFRPSGASRLFPQQRPQNNSDLVTNNLYPEFRTAENMHRCTSQMQPNPPETTHTNHSRQTGLSVSHSATRISTPPSPKGKSLFSKTLPLKLLDVLTLRAEEGVPR